MNNRRQTIADSRAELASAVAELLPGGRLERQVVPGAGGLELYLLNPDFAQLDLPAEQVARIMDNPLYWVFCWASGQVLAAFLNEAPEWVAGRRVLDFGSGSGVVAIAAARAGAREVIACDSDPLARQAIGLNAALNGVDLQIAGDLAEVGGALDCILVADVLYDRENLPWLDRFCRRADSVVLADSRIRDFDVPPYRRHAVRTGATFPDLDESAEFRRVSLYTAGEAPGAGQRG